jgi:hypothetical protein
MLTREKWCEWNSIKSLENRVFECALLPSGVSMLSVPKPEGEDDVHLPLVWTNNPGSRIMGGTHLQEHLSGTKLLDLLSVPQLPFRFFMYYEQNVLVWVDIYSNTLTIQASMDCRNSFVGETELVRVVRELKSTMFRRGFLRSYKFSKENECVLLPWMKVLEGRIRNGDSLVSTSRTLMFNGTKEGVYLYYNLDFDFVGICKNCKNCNICTSSILSILVNKQEIKGGILTGSRGTGKSLATAELILSEEIAFPPQVPKSLQHLVSLKATLVIMPYYLIAQWKHALKKRNSSDKLWIFDKTSDNRSDKPLDKSCSGLNESKLNESDFDYFTEVSNEFLKNERNESSEISMLVLSEASDLCNTSLEQFLSAKIVLCTNNYLRQTLASGANHGELFRQVQMGKLDRSTTNLPLECFYWNRIVYDEPENAVFFDETLMQGCCNLQAAYTWLIQSEAYLEDRHALVPYWRLLLRLNSPEAAFSRIDVGTISAFCDSQVYFAPPWEGKLSFTVVRASLHADAALALEMCAETMSVEGQLRFGCGDTRQISAFNWEHVSLSEVRSLANKRFQDITSNFEAHCEGSEVGEARVACMKQHFGRTLVTLIASAADGRQFPVCTICFQVAVDTIMLCGHAFCWECLFRTVVLRLTCPTCKFKVSSNNVFRIGIRDNRPWVKTEALVRMLREKESSKVYKGHTLVLLRWFGLLRMLKAQMEKQGVNSLAMCGNTRQCEHTWRQLRAAREPQIILLQLDQLGGLTLPNISHVVFYHAPNNTPESSKVLIDRAVQAVRCALTTEEDLRISFIVNENTVEDDIVKQCLLNVTHTSHSI